MKIRLKMTNARKQLYKCISAISTLGDMAHNARTKKGSRLRLPQNLQEGFTSLQVIHSFCNILFESWTSPKTNQYSYDVISLDNFNPLFYKRWNLLMKHNQSCKKLQTFTIALEKEKFIVLKYSAGERHERFLVLSQQLINFLKTLSSKHNVDGNIPVGFRNGAQDNAHVIVKLNLDSMQPHTIKVIENLIDNPYGITYGPCVQQLFERYILPEQEKPSVLLGHALTLGTVRHLITDDEKDAARKNLLHSRFVRVTDAEEEADTESSANEDDQETLRRTVLFERSDPQFAAPRTSNTDRASSPIEADVPSSIVRSAQESANLGLHVSAQNKNSSFKTTDHSRLSPSIEGTDAAIQCGEKNNEAQQIGKQPPSNSKCTQESNQKHMTTQTQDMSLKEILNMGTLNICCGLDSRYCRCYSLRGYVPKIHNYEIVRIRFLSIVNNKKLIVFEKYSYDVAYEDIYELGNLAELDDEELAKSTLAYMSLADAVKQYGKDVLEKQYLLTVPCQTFRTWSKTKNIPAERNDPTYLLESLDNESNMTCLNVLDTIYIHYELRNFQKVIGRFFAYFTIGRRLSQKNTSDNTTRMDNNSKFTEHSSSMTTTLKNNPISTETLVMSELISVDEERPGSEKAASGNNSTPVEDLVGSDMSAVNERPGNKTTTSKNNSTLMEILAESDIGPTEERPCSKATTSKDNSNLTKTLADSNISAIEERANNDNILRKPINEQDISSVGEKFPSCHDNTTQTLQNEPTETRSIGLEANISDIPFSIDCMAEIQCNVNLIDFSGDVFFQQGFETLFKSDYSTRKKHLVANRKFETSTHSVNVMKDLSICVLVKELLGKSSPLRTIPCSEDMASYITDSTEWNIDITGSAPLPFYLKELSAAYIQTENDFPSTLVAKKKIGNLVAEANSALNLVGINSTIPVLWSNTKTLELLTIYFHTSTKQLYLQFEKNLNQKYSLDTIYFPDSTPSKKIYNTRYGTFNTLPMEIQQTRKVIVKISNPPKPLLLIISDIFVFNSKIVDQKEAFLKAGQNQVLSGAISNDILNKHNVPNEQIATRNLSVSLIDSRIRASRLSAVKPANFYNENQMTPPKEKEKQIRKGTQLNKENQRIQPRFLEESIKIETRTLMEHNYAQSSDEDADSQLVIETSEDEEDTGRSVSYQNTNEKPLQEQNGQSERSLPNFIEPNSNGNSKEISIVSNCSREEVEKNVQKSSTKIRVGLPLQTKYAITQALGREGRRRNDKMFLKRNTIKDFLCSNYNGTPGKRRSTKYSTTNSKKKPEKSKELFKNRIFANNIRKSQEQANVKTNELETRSKGNSRLKERLTCDKGGKSNSMDAASVRKQISYDDMLSPRRDNYIFNSENARPIHIGPAHLSPLQTLENIICNDNKKTDTFGINTRQTGHQISKSSTNSFVQGQNLTNDFSMLIPTNENAIHSTRENQRVQTVPNNVNHGTQPTPQKDHQNLVSGNMETIITEGCAQELVKEDTLQALPWNSLLRNYPKSCNPDTISDRTMYKNVLKEKLTILLTHQSSRSTLHPLNSSEPSPMIVNPVAGASANGCIPNRKTGNCFSQSNCGRGWDFGGHEVIVVDDDDDDEIAGVSSTRTLHISTNSGKRRQPCDKTFLAKKSASEGRTRCQPYNTEKSPIIIPCKGSAPNAPMGRNGNGNDSACSISVQTSQVPNIGQFSGRNFTTPASGVVQQHAFETNINLCPPTSPSLASIQHSGRSSPHFIFSPHPPHTQPSGVPYFERQDDAGNPVSASHILTNTHNSPFVSTVSDLSHIRGQLPRMIHPGQSFIPYSYIQATDSSQQLLRSPVTHLNRRAIHNANERCMQQQLLYAIHCQRVMMDYLKLYEESKRRALLGYIPPGYVHPPFLTWLQQFRNYVPYSNLIQNSPPPIGHFIESNGHNNTSIFVNSHFQMSSSVSTPTFHYIGPGQSLSTLQHMEAQRNFEENLIRSSIVQSQLENLNKNNPNRR